MVHAKLGDRERAEKALSLSVDSPEVFSAGIASRRPARDQAVTAIDGAAVPAQAAPRRRAESVNASICPTERA